MTTMHGEYERTDVTQNWDELVGLTKLVRKLRWIGREDEARQLEDQLKSCPSCRRPSVLREPFSTD